MKRSFILALTAILTIAFAATAFADARELGGTSWKVTGINNGKQAVVSVLTGTELTANFDMKGILSGSAGVNTYTTTYDMYGNIITIGPAAATRKIATQPAGVMEQETMFLRALENVRSWRLSGGILTLSGEDGSTTMTLVPADTDDRVFLYKNADGKEALVQMLDADKLTMTFDGKTYAMKQAVSASGARYEALGDAGTTYWSKGDTALISIGGRDLGEFSLVNAGPQKLTQDAKPIVYRAGLMEVLVKNVDENHILLTANGETYWMTRTKAASGARYVGDADQTTEFWSHGDQATLSIKGVPYGGMLTRDDTPAIAPAARLMDVEWYVESVAGKNILPNTTVTMFFKSDGSLYGKAGINSYNSTWVDSGEKLMIGSAAATLMAGPQDQMDQEQAFLKALQEVNRFEVKNGKLFLQMKDGGEIVAKR